MFAGVDHGCWSCIFKFRIQATVASTTGEKCFVCYTEYNTHGISENIEICVSNVKKYLETDPTGASVEDNVICLISLITTLEDKDIVTDYNEQLIELKKSEGLPKRLMFMFLDILNPKKKK